MRFLDSSPYLHALLVPRRRLTREEQTIKNEAKKILERVEEGEAVMTSVVHVSEVLNVLESGLGLQRALGYLAWVLSCRNLQVLPVDTEVYANALPTATERSISANDALAYSLMKKHGASEIYSFDKHFDQLSDIARLP